MKLCSIQRRRESATSDEFKYVVKNPEGKVVAYTRTYREADNLQQELHELRRLRIILAWHSRSLSEAQACAALGCKPERLRELLQTCLKNALQ